jgi:hypothetical protein
VEEVYDAVEHQMNAIRKPEQPHVHLIDRAGWVFHV